jgi:GNAT superfamily N-acetyltransferase
MVEVRECTVLAFGAYPQTDTLLRDYAAESALEGLPAPKPHPETYFRRERAGVQHLFTAVAGGVLIGFIVLLVDMNGHYSEKLGVIESFFVGTEHRRTGAGNMLLAAAEERATREGVMDHKPHYRETHRVFFRSLA